MSSENQNHDSGFLDATSVPESYFNKEAAPSAKEDQSADNTLKPNKSASHTPLSNVANDDDFNLFSEPNPLASKRKKSQQPRRKQANSFSLFKGNLLNSKNNKYVIIGVTVLIASCVGYFKYKPSFTDYMESSNVSFAFNTIKETLSFGNDVEERNPLTEIDQIKREHIAKIERLESMYREKNAEIAGLESTITSLKYQLSNKVDYSEQVASKRLIVGLQSQIDELREIAASAIPAMPNTNLGGIEKEISNLTYAVNKVGDRSKENNSLIKNEKATRARLEAKVNQLSNELSTFKENIPDIQIATQQSYVDNSKKWVFKSAGRNVAVIYNKETRQQLRISNGVDVPGCGPVLSINVRSREIKTQNCNRITVQ